MILMKTTEEYLELLRAYKALKAIQYGILRIGILGSVSRGEQTPQSDVDIFVELKKTSLFILVHIKDELQELLGCNVDIVRLRQNMDTILRDSITQEGIYAYTERLESTCMLCLSLLLLITILI